MSANQNIENYWSIPSGPNTVLENIPFHLKVLDMEFLNYLKHRICLIFKYPAL